MHLLPPATTPKAAAAADKREALGRAALPYRSSSRSPSFSSRTAAADDRELSRRNLSDDAPDHHRRPRARLPGGGARCRGAPRAGLRARDPAGDRCAAVVGHDRRTDRHHRASVRRSHSGRRPRRAACRRRSQHADCFLRAGEAAPPQRLRRSPGHLLLWLQLRRGRSGRPCVLRLRPIRDDKRAQRAEWEHVVPADPGGLKHGAGRSPCASGYRLRG